MAENPAKVVLARLETMNMADMEALDIEQLRKLSNLLFHWHRLVSTTTELQSVRQLNPESTLTTLDARRYIEGDFTSATRVTAQAGVARAFFVHIWERPDTGTNGCIGLSEIGVRALQEFSRDGAVLAVLPETALDRFDNCLPASATVLKRQY